ncbi:uncharacterized protein LOC124938204 [Impatiens glandulifera]|uniref:uncharacterized protein LOC124938204 n=1 Tax=Impatiens glandulifera TaxID=253017 RepID=UPI001FB0B7CA|nr:uncharacterized protein LOC124938204 [Impatiens glandulifera]
MTLLLGPPEIGNLPPPPSPPSIIQISVDKLQLDDEISTGFDGDHHQDVDPESIDLTQMGLTENLAPTFLSTGNPCLDFFFHVVPDTPSDDLIKRLEEAWSYNQLTTLKLIFNLRGVRGTGKSDKKGFYTAAIWLHQKHPKTLACNVKAIADFGYFKDLLEILYRILNGSDVREIEKGKRSKQMIDSELNWNSEESDDEDVKKKRKKKTKILKTQEQIREEKEKARVLRKERKINKARKALEMYNQNGDYRFLHNQISDLFAELLKNDMKNLESGNLDKISLAPKWCPTIDSSYDNSTLICESIARKLFPRNSDPSYEKLEEAHYAYRIRERLRKEVLSPLHKAAELPEVFMSANQWNSLPYNRVPSVAMKNYKRHFIRHDKERFDDYLEKVKSGKAKIAAGALLPHEIMKEVENGDGDEVAELQWKRMVDDMAKKGKLSNCIAICDVSGSMSGIPMEVCVALGVLVSELSVEPWKGKVITFSENPQIHTIEGDSLAEKIQFVRTMDWGMNTNFQAVFDRLLEVAVAGKVSEEEMVKRVFVFSDMEFDSAEESSSEILDDQMISAGKKWETSYEAIERKFKEKGYVKVPEMVFWNLRSSRSTPVIGKQIGVALVSGFSKNLVSLFLEGDGDLNPEDVMGLAIAGKDYQELAVFD